MVIEQAYVWEDPDGEPSVSGFGDLAIVPRIVLCEHERFLLSANLEIELPTGSNDLGAGQEWHLAPFITTWADLGHWWTL
ncbi:MAG: transporter, partial [Akkermansiaceae bacterium]|nr:transporter [Akkermansiaceae bacterium]